MSSYTDVEEVLRQILVLRSSGASAATVEAALDEARAVFAELPPSPFGAPVKWAPDVAAVAAELGFSPAPAVARTRTPPLPKVAPKLQPRSHITTEEIDPSQVTEISPDGGLQAGIDEASLKNLASEIDAAIVASGGIGNLHVACMKDRVILTGIAADEDSRDEALIVAAKLAPGLQIDDEIDVA